MRLNSLKAIVKAAVLGVAVLLTGTGMASAQQQINLTAGASTITLPDGSSVPMWGYTCGAVTGTGAACANLNPAAALVAGTWSPVVITVPSGQALTINLTNNLSFAAGTGTNTVPTSLTIVGQLGGGLGDVTQRTTAGSPDHSNAQPQTWFIAGTPPGVPAAGVGMPPAQGDRVRSFSTEVAAGATTSLTFGTLANPLRPGTYLLESGTARSSMTSRSSELAALPRPGGRAR